MEENETKVPLEITLQFPNHLATPHPVWALSSTSRLLLPEASMFRGELLRGIVCVCVLNAPASQTEDRLCGGQSIVVVFFFLT